MVHKCCLCFGLLVTLIPALTFINLEVLIQFAVDYSDTVAERNPDELGNGLRTLRVGYEAAGGRNRDGALNIARVLRAKLWNAVWGPPATPSRAAWQRLLTTLQEADQIYLSAEYNMGIGETGALEVAEGHRYLTHLLRIGLETFLESDPLSPTLTRIVTPSLKMQGDNPDAVYYWAHINSSAAYILRGTLVGEAYFSITLYGSDTPGRFGQTVLQELNDLRLTTAADADGRRSWAVVIAASEPSAEFLAEHRAVGAQWLPANSTLTCIVTRHYFEHRSPAAADPTVNPVLSLKAVSPAGVPPSPATPEEVGRKLDLVSLFLRDHAHGKALPDPANAPKWFSTKPNHFATPMRWSGQNEGLGAVDIHYAGAPFALRPQEALLVTGTMPECRFANVVLWNRFLQTLDYTRGPVSLNRVQLGLAGPGPFRFVLAAADPGVPGWPWLSTEGRPRGFIFWRYLLAVDPVEAPQGRVVDLAAWRSEQLHGRPAGGCAEGECSAAQ
eukprot:TRINITY_DN46870_c0_g1_i1.p1 TRINITY_DN46870_c0_g1~~TRINITY_DN46870_c0_g1_i1.p1  ORF type:complete len:527 (+),score=158.71 TRINITY_DN46870_c0_g1_i1:83-1582(+)